MSGFVPKPGDTLETDMENQSIKSISKERRDRLINNVVEAYATLFRTVALRTQSESMSERIKKGIQMKNEREKYEQPNRI